MKKQNFFANDKVVNNSEILSDKLRNIRFKERDLHPILAYFINSNPNFNALPKTIYHEISQKNSKGLDKWLYPDMVGVSFEKFNNDETYKFLEKFQNIPVKFYSFEIKKEINVSNFREYYFQAVSNSSWANEGYLVALDIDESDEELTMLITKTALSFGIGVLSLDSENIDQSKIIAPAKFKELLDFSLIDELSQKNKNFQNFIKTVNEYDIKNEIRYKGEFDKILNSEEIKQYMLEKNIKRT